ncbi:Protein CASC5, partial [Colius striatus]
MDKIYTEPNVESDNTEHIRGKRLSSILKAPRNPLEDLGNGQELTQDINGEKRRKTSRRVSFANTIKVFQRDLKNNTAESESTGMNTLLHAPIQALAQQAEWCDADNAAQRTARHDTTFIFSEENEMEMTASHTAVIARNLRNNAADTSGKIDVTAFLAGLNSNGCGAAEMSQDHTNRSCPSSGQNEDATPVKKIDFNEFLMSLKSNRETLSPAEGPEKENVFFGSSRASEDVAASSELAYSHEPLDACNVTKVFREQEAGMEMTKCQASAVQAVFAGSISSETVFRGDKTVVFSKCDDMEITGNYTDVIYNDSAKSSSHHQSYEKPVSTNASLAETRRPARADGDTTMSLASLDTRGCQDSDRQEETHILRAVPTRVDSKRDRTSQPPTGTSQLPSLGEKSVVFPSGENMDLTGSCAGMVPGYSTNAGSAAPGKTVVFAVAEDMEMTKTHTAVASCAAGVQDREAVPGGSAVPAIVFTHNQEDMEITASHTTAVNNNIDGL